MSKAYGAAPVELGVYPVACSEMMMYQYLPIKLSGFTEITREPRLVPFDSLIGAACCDFIGVYGLDRFVRSYVYLTAKHLFQGPGSTFNRQGYHCDGFLTDDINYIWYSKTPTIFNLSRFELSPDDSISMQEMEFQAEERHERSYQCATLLRLDQYCVHKVRLPKEAELRTFFKLSISGDKYDLEGNAHNHLLDYDWPMRKRSLVRNVPQQLATASEGKP